MVNIPTTERKYYNTEKKLNTLAAYSSALLPAAQSMQQVVQEQESIKMDTLGLQARMEMNEITNNWRMQNENNPTDPTALKDLQSQYDEVLGKYREQVDPLYRYNWDIAGNKLKGAFDLQNQTWGFKQKQVNAKRNIADSVSNYLKLAYQYGQEASEDEAMADFEQSYQKLLDYGAKNLGTEEAANLLKNYQEKFVTNYIGGVASKDPQKALDMLQNDEKIKEIVGDDSYKMMNKIIKAEKEKHDFQIQYNQYQTQVDLENELNTMSPFMALNALEEQKDSVSDKWYKAKKNSLMKQTASMSETVADTYTDLLMKSQNISKKNANDILKQSNDLLTDIEDAYGKGELKLDDKAKLIKEVNDIRKEALPEYIEADNTWFSYGIKDANNDFSNTLINSDKVSDAMLEYHRTISQGNYNAESKRKLVKSIVDKYNKDTLTTMSIVKQSFNIAPKNTESEAVYPPRKGAKEFKQGSALKIRSFGYKIKNGLPSFETQSEAEEAYKRGYIQYGDPIIISGVEGYIK